MKFEITLLPNKSRWRWVALQLLIAGILSVSAVWFATSMPGRSFSGELAPPDDRELAISDRLKLHVTTLAQQIGERNLAHLDALNRTREYIETNFRASNLEVSEQSFDVDGATAYNLETEITGHGKPNELILIGAHYDTAPGSPGADDNATGVAALLELANAFSSQTPVRTIRFVAFANEEPPYFQTKNMGSLVYAKRASDRSENIRAMISLEALGFYSNSEGSQLYPFPFSLFYPTRGNFIGFVANTSSRSKVRRAIGIFRNSAQIPSEGVSCPGWLTGVGWSDQWSFWKQGFTGLMITDTAIFRNPHYHRRSDLPETLDFTRLARVLFGISAAVSDLANDQ